jgi:HAD superfamily hydrolase (TIGR01459 family)
MSALDTLDPKYRALLCDVWGVIHDGVTLYPGVTERLRRWRGEGRKVILLTNAPRTAEAVAEQLGRIGLPADCWDHIATSGEAGITALLALGEPVGFIGSEGDREILEGRGVRFTDGPFRHFAVTGIDGIRRSVGDYHDALTEARAQDALLHCLNPDKLVIRGGVAEPCAGAIADAYAQMGGRVVTYGKPNAPIYDHALALAGVGKDAVVAVGDALATDILGAALYGIDAVFVRGGISEGVAFPPDFGAANGLSGWHPVAIVDGLA